MHRYSQSLARHAACVYCALLTYLIHYELKMDLIKVAEEAFATGKQHPEFGPGDTITVAYRIKEGNKERFTVRKISDNIGVERIFPIESPFIDSITVNKYGKVRRAKLYYLRNLTGKKARIKERRVVK